MHRRLCSLRGSVAGTRIEFRVFGWGRRPVELRVWRVVVRAACRRVRKVLVRTTIHTDATVRIVIGGVMLRARLLPPRRAGQLRAQTVTSRGGCASWRTTRVEGRAAAGPTPAPVVPVIVVFLARAQLSTTLAMGVMITFCADAAKHKVAVVLGGAV